MTNEQDALLDSVNSILGMEEDENTEMAVREFHAPVVFEDGKPEADLMADAWDDYHYVRKTLQTLIETGQKALAGALDSAISSHHPRGYVVDGTIMKQIAEATDHLVKLKKKMKEFNN